MFDSVSIFQVSWGRGFGVLTGDRMSDSVSIFQVSWGRGFEVLTGGLMLFASDRRFQPLHQEYSEDWGLRILSVRASDAGWYFCQISTSPPVSHHLYLHVVGEHTTSSNWRR